MKEYFQSKTVGFYLTVIATILAIIGLVNYASAPNAISIVYILVGIAIAVEVVMVMLSGILGNKPLLDLASSICAVLMSIAIAISFRTQLDAIGYVVSGLYTLEQIIQFVYFVAFAAVSLLIYIIASYMKLSKR